MMLNAKASQITEIEQQFWLLSQQEKSSAYNVNSVFFFEDLDLPRFITSINSVINDIEILRSSYEMIEGEIVRFDKHQTCSVLENTFSANSVEEAKTWVNKVCDQKFDLVNEPLVKVVVAKLNGTENIILAISIHHIVIDLKSKNLFSKLISENYNNEGKSLLSPKALNILNNYDSYRGFQESWLDSDKGIAASNYWRKRLKTVSNIKLNSPNKNNLSCENQKGSIALNASKSTWQSVKSFAQDNILSPYVILLTTYYLLLAKFSGESNFCIAVPLSNRKNNNYADTLGCFVNTVPISIDFSDDDSVSDVLKKMRLALLEAHRHQDYPSLRIISDNFKDAENKNIYQHGFTFEHPMKLGLNGVNSQVLYYEPINAQLDLFFRLWEEQDTLQGHLEYDNQVFDNLTAIRFSESFKTLLSSIAGGDNKPLAEISIISNQDKLQLERFNNTDEAFLDTLNLKALFENQVLKTPNNTAVVFENESYSYAEFNEKVNQLAHFLNHQGVNQGDVVAVICERSINMMVCIYSILKLGAVYVPIDSELPQERIDYMLSQSCSCAILTQSDIKSQYNKALYNALNIDELEAEIAHFPKSNPEVNIKPNDLAYIIFTSGSTGKPKGVMNCHLGVANVMLWMKKDFQPVFNDVVLQKTPYSFDISLFEIYWPLLVGATVAIAKHGCHKDVYQIQKQIAQYQVTILHIVPSILNALSHEKSLGPTSLRALVCCGEALLPSAVTTFFQAYDKTELINLYGPTEAAIAVSSYRCKQNDDHKNIPIGKPVFNTQLHILDSNLKQLPIGAVGELCIAGSQVAHGYVNNDNLTQAQFIASPFSEGSLYKTGDLACWTNEGELAFFGRSDSQVKFNGLRIELSEIEAIMHKYEHIQESVVKIEKSPNGSEFIGVVYTVKDNTQVIDKVKLKAFLAKFLPVYMLPVSYLKIDELPLTSSGKIDRKQLPKLAFSDDERPINDINGLSEIQKVVFSAWSKVLKHQNFSIDVQFFEVGGDSMSLMQVFNILDNEFPNKLSSVDLFRFVSVRAIAHFIEAFDNQKVTQKQNTRAGKMRSAIKRNTRVRKRQKECDV